MKKNNDHQHETDQRDIMLDLYFQEGVSQELARALAKEAVLICLKEKMIVIPEGTTDMVTITVHVDSDYNIRIKYGDTEVGMSTEFSSVESGYGGSIHAHRDIFGGFLDFLERLFAEGAGDDEDTTKNPVS